MTPIGISAGDDSVRARRSAQDEERAAEEDRQRQDRRGSCAPARSRTVCGTMMPTKPMSPDTATAAAVPSDAATTTTQPACGGRRRPSVVASSSPTASTSSDAPVREQHDRGQRRRTAAISATSRHPAVESRPRIQV